MLGLDQVEYVDGAARGSPETLKFHIHDDNVANTLLLRSWVKHTTRTGLKRFEDWKKLGESLKSLNWVNEKKMLWRFTPTDILSWE